MEIIPQKPNTKGGKHTLLNRLSLITPLLYLPCLLLFSCSEGDDPLNEEPAPEVKKFRPDFAIVTVHKTIEDVFHSLRE